MEPVSERVERAGSASREELRRLLHDRNAEVLAALLENPAMDEDLLLLLLHRNDLPGEILDAIARRRDWMRSYRVKLRLAGHPQTPRLIALPLIRQLFLFDLVNLGLLPSTPAEIRRIAEDSIIAKLAQLPLGQKLTLARRGSARIAAALLAEGVSRVIPPALDNALLSESQVLKVLARDDLAAQLPAMISAHPKWSCLYNVRMALVRHPLTPLARVLSFLPDLTLGDLSALIDARTLSTQLREYIRAEVVLRKRASRRRARREALSQNQRMA
jgi:hypothetical protein